MFIYTPYFYIIKHKPSSKQYAGSRWKSGCNPVELLQPGGYQTSSKIVQNLIQKDGLDAFEIVRIDTVCDGLHPHEYETMFLEEHLCSSSEQWINGHNNKIMRHDDPEFRQMMLKLYGVDHWAKTKEGREFHSKRTSERNMLPENIERWNHMNKYNNPTYKPENRKAASLRMQEYCATIGDNHPAKKPENKKLSRDRMKTTMANQVLLTCPHCGFQSTGKGNMHRWHFNNCKKLPHSEVIS